MDYIIKILGIQILGPAVGGASPYNDTFLVGCDFNGRDGWGTYDVSGDPGDARRFKTMADAVDYYRRTSDVRPIRPDGRPNRPLTALTVEVIPEGEI